MAIISCFDADVDDLGLGEIADRSGLRASTAHRIVRALVRGGFLAQDSRTERYHLGARLALLGQTAIARYGLDLAQPDLENLARATGEAASLGVRNGGDVSSCCGPSRHSRCDSTGRTAPACRSTPRPWARRCSPSARPTRRRRWPSWSRSSGSRPTRSPPPR